MTLALENQRLFDEEQQARRLLDQRVKELDCLSDIGRRIDQVPLVPEFLEWVSGRIPLAMQYPDLCVAAFEFEGQVYGDAQAVDLPCQIVQGLLIGGEQLGRAYVAYREAHDFLDEESALLGDISRRVSGYIENRRLLEETQAALAEVEAVHRSYLRQAWQDHLSQRAALERSGLLYDQAQAERPEDVTAVPDLWLPEMEQALARGGSAVARGGSEDGERTGMATPITIRGETIGVLGVEAPSGDYEWTEEDRVLVETIGDQLAQTLESTRLFEETRRRAERERLIGEITAKIRASTEVQDILETAAVELGRALGTSRALVRLTSGEPQE
jgi:GAF domain-containing protein